MISGSKGTAKHEKSANYAVNQRISDALELRELLCSRAIRDIKLNSE